MGTAFPHKKLSGNGVPTRENFERYLLIIAIKINGLTVGTTKKLQIAQKAAARLNSDTMRHEHISGILRELHWHPATKRCQYKLLVLRGAKQGGLGGSQPP